VNEPSASVLVTVYNRAQYIAESLDSILRSTFEDFELLVVDDVSSDESFAIAKTYEEVDSRVKVFRNERNLGDYGNRMRAAQLARGEYLKYVDSDDVLYPHSLELMIGAMRDNPDVALGLSHSMPEDEQPYPWKLTPVESWRKHFLGSGCLGCGPSGAIIRRDAFFEAGGFKDHGVLSDTDLWIRLSAQWAILLFPPGLVWWRRHSGQEFTRADAATTYLETGYDLVVEALTSEESPLTRAERDQALRRVRRNHARRLISLAVKSRRPATALRMAQSAGLAPIEFLRGLRGYE
jgi:glycosyltransferase involved in cell wall biosynthesis